MSMRLNASRRLSSDVALCGLNALAWCQASEAWNMSSMLFMQLYARLLITPHTAGS